MIIENNGAFGQFMNDYQITVLDSGYADVDKRWQNYNVCSPFTRIYYVKSGSGIIKTADSTTILRPGNVYIIPLGTKYDCFCEGSLGHLYFHINIIAPNGYDILKGICHCAEASLPEEKVERLKEAYMCNDFLPMFELRYELYRSLKILIEKLGIENFGEMNYSPEVKNTIEYIRKNLSLQLSVSTIAKQTYLSQSTLCNRFKEELGVSIGKYIDRLIFFKAEQMLTKTDISIKDISEELGFCDQFYFSRRFAKRLGKTPLAYRKLTKSANRT